MKRTRIFALVAIPLVMVSTTSHLVAQTADSAAKGGVQRGTSGPRGSRNVSTQGDGQGNIQTSGGAQGVNGNGGSFTRTTTPARGSGTATSSGARTTATGRQAGYDASASRTDTGVVVKGTSAGPRGGVYSTEGLVQKSDTGVTRTSQTTNQNGRVVRATQANTSASDGAVERRKAVRTPRGETRSRTIRAARP
jgi:hypothetical protein